jgi:hypothetical protein
LCTSTVEADFRASSLLALIFFLRYLFFFLFFGPTVVLYALGRSTSSFLTLDFGLFNDLEISLSKLLQVGEKTTRRFSLSATRSVFTVLSHNREYNFYFFFSREARYFFFSLSEFSIVLSQLGGIRSRVALSIPYILTVFQHIIKLTGYTISFLGQI